MNPRDDLSSSEDETGKDSTEDLVTVDICDEDNEDKNSFEDAARLDTNVKADDWTAEECSTELKVALRDDT